MSQYAQKDIDGYYTENTIFISVSQTIECLGYIYTYSNGTLTMKGIGGNEITIKEGQKYFIKNGKKIYLKHGAITKNGKMYFPVEFYKKVFPYQIQISNKVDINSHLLYYKKNNSIYWLDRKTGNLYCSQNRCAPQKIATLDLTCNKGGIITKTMITQTKNKNYVVDIYMMKQWTLHGEDCEHYKFYINSEKNIIYKTIKKDVFNTVEQDNETLCWNEYVILGKDDGFQIIHDSSGEIIKTYSFKDFFEDDNEYKYKYVHYNGRYVLVRQNEDSEISHLILLDLETEKKLILYKELLPEEDRTYIEKKEAWDVIAQGRFEFMKEKDNTLYFNYIIPCIQGGGEVEYQYKLQ
jgi:hypothetical protein